MSRLLDFFENSPILHTIILKDSLPNSSDAPPNRTVFLPYLDKLSISAQPPHSMLLNHLPIPTSAMLVLDFRFNGDRPPLPDYLPKPSADFLSCITTVNLLFRVVKKSLQLKGPSGETYVFGYRVSGNAPSYTVDWQILRSLYQSIRSTTERLTITQSEPTTPIRTDRSQVFQTLLTR